MKLKNNQLIDTTPGRLYTVTCAVDVSVYEMDGAVQGLKLLDYKAADGQKEFRATSLQVKIVTGSASEVQGSVTEVFKGAPALASAGGGGDLYSDVAHMYMAWPLYTADTKFSRDLVEDSLKADNREVIVLQQAPYRVYYEQRNDRVMYLYDTRNRDDADYVRDSIFGNLAYYQDSVNFKFVQLR